MNNADLSKKTWQLWLWKKWLFIIEMSKSKIKEIMKKKADCGPFFACKYLKVKLKSVFNLGITDISRRI